MKLLRHPEQLSREFHRLLESYDHVSCAVAWASVGFPASDALLRSQGKLRRSTIGTHFYQTHPVLIEKLIAHREVRFVLQPDGVFHPKLYLFWTGSDWEAIVGSPNFTSGAFERNLEVALLIGADDPGAQETLQSIRSCLQTYWALGRRLLPEDLAAYREVWRRKQHETKRLAGRFGTSRRSGQDSDGGYDILSIDALRISWLEFLARVQTENERRDNPNCLHERLYVIMTVRGLFERYRSLASMPTADRQAVAGLPSGGEQRFLWFGNMRGRGVFFSAVNNNNSTLSRALDYIPLNGPVSRFTYDQYFRMFRQVIPGNSIATGTRLLAMKRPDLFVCVDTKNQAGLCRAFGVPISTLDFASYYESIAERIWDSVWWNALEPAGTPAKQIWGARAAFLDALFYEGLE